MYKELVNTLPPADLTKASVSDDHKAPPMTSTSPGQLEAARLEENDIHDSAIETGSIEDVVSSVTVDESDMINLSGNNPENPHDQGENGFWY